MEALRAAEKSGVPAKKKAKKKTDEAEDDAPIDEVEAPDAPEASETPAEPADSLFDADDDFSIEEDL